MIHGSTAVVRAVHEATITPVAGLSREQAMLPETPTFSGPTTRALAAARMTVPLLLGGWMLALASQGALLAPLVIVGVGTALSLSALADLWLQARRRTLEKTSRALVVYTRRVFGDDHELTRRAQAARNLLTDGVTFDPDVATRVEEILRYTVELTRRRGVFASMA
jgi:hypothetical protein